MIFFRKILYIILTVIIFSPQCINSQSNENPKNVFVLFSLGYGLPALDAFMQSFRTTIKEQYTSPLNIYVQYLEIDKFQEEALLKEKIDLMKHKFAIQKMDLLVTLGPDAEMILDKYAKDYFVNIPILNFDTKSIDPALGNTWRKKGSAYVYQEVPVKKNIESALQIFPDTKHIYFICGMSMLDARMKIAFRNELKSYEDKINIHYLDGLSMKTTLKIVNNLPEHSIIFMPTFQLDSAGISYYTLEAINLVYENTKAPIICIYSTSIGGGAFGGYVINMSKAGTLSAEYSIKILNGLNPDSIEAPVTSLGEFIFDWRQLKKNNINEKSLPTGSTILNHEYTFTEKYGNYILAGNLFIGIESALVVILFYLYRKQKKMAYQLVEQEDRYKTLVDYNRLSELSELTASLSHELNQPLTAILSSSQAAQRFIANKNFDKELFDEILANIVQDVKRASGIMNSLRGMIKKDTREKNRVNLNKLALDVSQLFSSQAAIKDMKLDTHFDEYDPFIFADSILIQQVILNLLLNASEALEKKEHGIKKIILKTETSGEIVTVSVSDNGTGVKDDLKNLVFKPFFSTKYSGLGVGLAICRSIIEDHEGKLYFENLESGGAVFLFKLKIVQ